MQKRSFNFTVTKKVVLRVFELWQKKGCSKGKKTGFFTVYFFTVRKTVFQKKDFSTVFEELQKKVVLTVKKG